MWFGEAHGPDQPREADRAVQPQQGDVVVVVEGLEVWMEKNLVHRTPGRVMLIPDVMETQKHLGPERRSPSARPRDGQAAAAMVTNDFLRRCTMKSHLVWPWC